MSSRILLKNILAHDAFFMVNKELIKQFGLDEAALISVLVDREEYAYANNILKGEFFQCPLHYIEEKLNLGRRPIEDAAKKLRNAGLIDCKLFGCPAVKYYSINHEAVINIISIDDSQFVQNEQTCLHETSKLDCSKSTTYKNNIDKNNNLKSIPPSANASPQGDVKKKDDLDLSFISDAFLPIMQKWLKYKKERRQSYKQIGIEGCYHKLLNYSNGDLEIATAIIEDAIANNYHGFFRLRDDNTRTQRKTATRPVHPDRCAVLPALNGI